ncbi:MULTISPECIES: hypothetical protein [unclassified Spirosoma]|uniref:hypothetical protein n=1 Tax=unclassified Spirosoma TaxID=2621999 RepID=UPI000B05AE1F|nr:hypothetical protein [Spirosoma sp. 48-14]
MRQYRDCQSGFANWEQRAHAKDWLLYPPNLGTHLSLDETSLSQGELYTILTNKAAKGGQVGPPMRKHRGDCGRHQG